MTDGELLEQAAKAIGLKYIKPAEGYGGEFGLIAGIETLHSVTDRCGATTWSPLEDDGDALRLAVKLKLSISAANPAFIEVAIFKDGEAHLLFRDGTMDSGWNEDPYAATRRAIVRAAAEIGKAK
jgi:hypothetical protein